MPNYLINLSKKIQLVWNSQVPAHLFYAVWAFVLTGFLIYAARFSFLGFNYYGLPQYPDAWIFWFVGASCLGLGYLLKTGFVLYYLALLPLIYCINLTELLRFGNLPVHVFDFLALGCFLGILPKKSRISLKADWSSFVVGCFGCVMFISSAYSLIHPSFTNSISIIFSVFGWNGDYNEFNGAWMGHNVLAGCLIYLFCVNAPATKFSLKNAIQVQFFVFLLCVAVWFVYLYISNYSFTKISGFTAIPNAPKHDLAGWLILLFGFYFGMAIFGSNSKSKKSLHLFCAFITATLIYLSAARSALLVIPVLLILGLFIAENRKRYSLMLAGLAVLALPIIVLLQKSAIPIATSAFSTITSFSLFSADVSFLERIGIWANALMIFLSNPIAGVGLGSSTSLSPHFSWNGFLGTLDWRVYADVNAKPALSFLTTHNAYNAHSDLLEIGASTGLNGLILLITIYIFSIFCILKKIKHSNCSEKGLLGGLFLALTGYFIFSQADTRITSFLGSCAMWQFIALGVCSTRSASTPIPVSTIWLWPAAMPFLYAICVAVVLGGNYLPGNRTYGVWNWNMRDSQGSFLLAKEAQFVIPPFEELEGLSFRLPEDSQSEELILDMQINDQKLSEFKVGKLNDSFIAISAYRKPGEWTKVTILCPEWCGRGALGSPFGVKPYALKMKKMRPAGYLGIPNDTNTQPLYFFQK